MQFIVGKVYRYSPNCNNYKVIDIGEQHITFSSIDDPKNFTYPKIALDDAEWELYKTYKFFIDLEEIINNV